MKWKGTCPTDDPWNNFGSSAPATEQWLLPLDTGKQGL